MSQPWNPDRALTHDQAAALIRHSFHGVSAEELTFLGSGWEFDAYLTTDGWVVRFPRRAESAMLFRREQPVLQLVSRFLPPRVAVPRVELLAEPALDFPYPFGAHRYIGGVPADEIAPPLHAVLAREIGEALGALHPIPASDARAAGVAEDTLDAESEQQWIEQGLAALQGLRGSDPAIDRAARWVEGAALAIPRYSGPLRVIHQDLGPEHILVDPSTGHLTGIIDWTDVVLGDAARDFVFLVAWRGWAFAEEVMRSYQPPLDPGFRDRLRFMSRLLTPLWLGLSVQRDTDVAKLTSWVHNAFAP